MRKLKVVGLYWQIFLSRTFDHVFKHLLTLMLDTSKVLCGLISWAQFNVDTAVWWGTTAAHWEGSVQEEVGKLPVYITIHLVNNIDQLTSVCHPQQQHLEQWAKEPFSGKDQKLHSNILKEPWTDHVVLPCIKLREDNQLVWCYVTPSWQSWEEKNNSNRFHHQSEPGHRFL